MEHQTELTFEALNKRIDELPDHSSISMEIPTKVKYCYAIAFLAFALCLLSAKALPDSRSYSVVFSSIFLSIEIAAIAVSIFYYRSVRISGFRSERIEYAEQLDHDLEHHTKLIEWLSDFPRARLAVLADYAELRHERFRERLPLLTGAIEKFGIFPVLLAIFVQVKAMHWPLDVSWPEIIFYFFLALLYWQCMLGVSARYRVQFFEMLLKRALKLVDERSKSTEPDTAENLTNAREVATIPP